MCTLTQMEQPTDMGCRTALFEVPWARSWKWLGPDLVPSLTTYQVLWCSGRRRRNTLRWKPNWNHDDGYSIMIMVIIFIYIYDYSVIIIIILMVVHDHDPWVWWAQSMHSLYSAFFFPWLIVKCCPRSLFSATCWVALHGSPEIKGFTDLNEPFCCHLNRTPPKKKNILTYCWWKWHAIWFGQMNQNYSHPPSVLLNPKQPRFNRGFTHIDCFFCTVRIYWGLIQILLDASPSNWHTSTPFDTLWTDAGVKQGCLICAWWLWVLWRSSVSIQCPSRNMWGFGC
jgi:hypothetical protein